MDDTYLASYLTETHYSDDALVLDRSVGSDDTSRTKLRALAEKKAIDPSVFEEFPPFFFGGEISSDRWDSYDTRMGETTRTNYAKEAAAGVAYLRSHNKYGDPTGHTLTGTLDGKAVRAEVYMIQDPDSSIYIAKIRAAIVRAQSVGFTGGEWMCTICNRDMQIWWRDEGCPHLLGMMYQPVDSKGKAKEGVAPVKARATIENAHLVEVSGVYAGATPGAMIDKARALADQNQLDYRLHDSVQVRYKIELPPVRRIHPVAKVGTERSMPLTEEEIAELQAKVLKGESADKTLRELRATFVDVLPMDRRDNATLADTLEYLKAERLRLTPLADDGRQYRADLVEDAMKEGARALGEAFGQETYKAVLEASPIAAIKRMRDDWAVIAAKTFPAGRQTDDDAEKKAQAAREAAAKKPSKYADARAYA